MGLVGTLELLLEPIRLFLENNPTFHALATIILYFLAAFIVHYVLKNGVHHLLSKSKNKFADKIVTKVNNPVSFVIVLSGFFVALEKIFVENTAIISLVETLIILVITYAIMAIADTVIDFWGHNVTGKKGEEFHDEVLPLTKGTSRIIFGLIGFLFLLDSWGVEIVPLLASFGVAGAILGFAFQDSMKNIFGGIALIMDKDFHIGDVIKLDNGEMGEVIEITLRSTKIKNYDNEVIIVPNALLATSKFTNFAKPTQTIRLTIDVSVAYGSDPHKVEEVLLGALKNNNKILKYPKRLVRFEKLGAYSLDFKVLFFISDYHERFMMQDQVTKDIYDALYREGLHIPFPTRTLMDGKPLKYKPKKKAN